MERLRTAILHCRSCEYATFIHLKTIRPLLFWIAPTVSDLGNLEAQRIED